MKRLRKRLSHPISFYMAGEYGAVYDKRGQPIKGLLGRPHFHCLVFGHSFPDRIFYRKSPSGIPLYNSGMLSDVWGHGYATVQDFSIEAAAYVARYCTKKITGPTAERHYTKVDESTGEILEVSPEYNRMSLNPPIGRRWLEQYASDCYPKDYITHNGQKFRPPKYYDNYFEGLHPEEMEAIKARRADKARQTKVSEDRLEAMHQCKVRQNDKLLRTL